MLTWPLQWGEPDLVGDHHLCDSDGGPDLWWFTSSHWLSINGGKPFAVYLPGDRHWRPYEDLLEVRCLLIEHGYLKE